MKLIGRAKTGKLVRRALPPLLSQVSELRFRKRCLRASGNREHSRFPLAFTPFLDYTVPDYPFVTVKRVMWPITAGLSPGRSIALLFQSEDCSEWRTR